MKKVIVIGCPGSGKSTFARALAEKTGLPLYHLDRLYWNPDRTTVEKSVFRARLGEVMAQDAWIIDGNYGSTMEWRIKTADTVFFLDLPTEVCLAGVRGRIGTKRPDLPWIEEREDPEFMAFIEGFMADRRPGILRLMESYPDREWIRFESHAQIDAYLASWDGEGDQEARRLAMAASALS